MFLRNDGLLSTDYMVLYPRSHNSLNKQFRAKLTDPTFQLHSFLVQQTCESIIIVILFYFCDEVTISTRIVYNLR
jgi:hypothetical protein